MYNDKVHAQATCAPDDDALSTARTPSGRDRARALRARAPDPGADHTRDSRSPRRYARCAWTPRCARALICDREACGQHRAGARGCNGLCKGGRISPALHRRRRGSRRPKQAGGRVTPCSRILFVGGEPGGAGRAHSERKQALRRAQCKRSMAKGAGATRLLAHRGRAQRWGGQRRVVTPLKSAVSMLDVPSSSKKVDLPLVVVVDGPRGETCNRGLF